MKTLLINLFLLSTTLLSAQNTHFWGATEFGGEDNAGTIYKVLNDGTQHEVMHTFDVQNPGAFPRGNMVEAPDGMLYGVTETKGDFSGSMAVNRGTLFKYNPDSNTIVTLRSFDYTDSIHPSSPLTIGPDSNLYGFSYGQGKTSMIYRYNIKRNTTEIVANLDDSTGYWGLYKLTLGSNDKLYGVNTKGGKYNVGTLFEFNCNTDTYRKIHDFHQDTTVAIPNSSLMLASNGILYGTSEYSYNNNSAIFSFDPITDSVKLEKIMPGLSASNLIEYPSGVIHGTTDGVTIGGIFQYIISNDSLFFPVTFQFFQNTPSVRNQFLLTKSNKILFVSGWGSYPTNRVLEYFPQNGTLKTIKQLEQFRIPIRNSGLIETSKGKIFGTIKWGGMENEGFLYSLDSINSPDSINFSYQKELDFGFAPEGRNPEHSPTYANNKFYGLTSRGGEYGKGVLYSFDPKYQKYTVHINFNDSLGTLPQGELLFLNNKLYGTCNQKGQFNGGSLFEFDPFSESFQILSYFDSSNLIGARNPIGTLENIGDKLYGVNTIDALNLRGAVFEFNLTNLNLRKVGDFEYNGPPSDYYPSGSLFKASDGNLYGIIGSGSGALYRYEPSADSIAILRGFNLLSGIHNNPNSTFIEFNQKLYAPLIYEQSLLEFDYNDSSYAEIGLVDSNSTLIPEGRLIESNGKFFGVTHVGLGNIFSYDFQTDSLTHIYQFDGFNGAGPSNSIFEISACSTLATGILSDGSTFNAVIENADLQWLNCDQGYSPVLGEINSSFTPSDSAFYALEISKYGCKDTTACVSLRTVGINEHIDLSTKITSIFPNPFEESFQIKSSLQKSIEVRIYSQDGRKVYEEMILPKDLITPSVPPGFYILEIRSSDQLLRQPIIKR